MPDSFSSSYKNQKHANIQNSLSSYIFPLLFTFPRSYIEKTLLVLVPCMPGVFMRTKKIVLVVCTFKLICKLFQNLYIQTHRLVEYFSSKSRLIWSAFLLKESKCPDDLSFSLGNKCIGFIPTSVMYHCGFGCDYCCVHNKF